MINCIIIDQNPSELNRLNDYLSRFKSLNVIAKTSTEDGAYKKIKHYRTELVFLILIFLISMEMD